MNIDEIRNILSKEVKSANAKLQRLNAQLGNKNVWAAKRLFNQLSSSKLKGNTLTEKGYIKYSKSLTDIEVRAIYNAVSAFNMSKTSTISGIEEVKKERIKNIAGDLDIDDSDAESLFQIFDNKGIMHFIDDSNITPSDLFALINEAKEMPRTGRKNFFKDQLNIIGDLSNDIEVRKTINKIYNKYIR